MDPVTLVVAALAAGVGTGIKDAAGTAVRDAYGALRILLTERFKGHPTAEIALQEHSLDPDGWQQPLITAVREVGVDRQMVDLANRILAERNEDTEYTVNAEKVQGLQQGSQNTQTNNFE